MYTSHQYLPHASSLLQNTQSWNYSNHIQQEMQTLKISESRGKNGGRSQVNLIHPLLPQNTKVLHFTQHVPVSIPLVNVEITVSEGGNLWEVVHVYVCICVWGRRCRQVGSSITHSHLTMNHTSVYVNHTATSLSHHSVWVLVLKCIIDFGHIYIHMTLQEISPSEVASSSMFLLWMRHSTHIYESWIYVKSHNILYS